MLAWSNQGGWDGFDVGEKSNAYRIFVGKLKWRDHSGGTDIRGPFAKFVDSPYYYKPELCGGAVTVSFSKYLPWQAIHFLQRSTHFSKTCCRPLITSKFLASELPFHGWKSPVITWGEIWIEFCVRFRKSGLAEPHQNIRHTVQTRPMRFLGFSNHERGAPRQEISKWSTANSTFLRRGWSVVRSSSLAQGRYFKKDTVTAPPQSSHSE
jgi:hypothetical protein